MAKNSSASSAPVKRTSKKGKLIRDEDIDYSDIPPLTDDELKRARRVGRPKSESTKQLIAIRIDPKVLKGLQALAKKLGKPYQTYIHEELEKLVS